jgi:hypothetical protein
MAEIQDPAGPPVEGDGVNFTREQIEELLAAACNFQGQARAAREKCRDDFRDAEREEDNTLRVVVDGLVASLRDMLSQPIERVDSGISYQIGLVTSYVRTHFIVTDLILNGDLVEAVTLIRKQLESVARLNEHSFSCLDMHHFVAIYFLAWITEKMPEWYPRVDHQEARMMVGLTIAYAKSIDVIRFPDLT